MFSKYFIKHSPSVYVRLLTYGDNPNRSRSSPPGVKGARRRCGRGRTATSVMVAGDGTVCADGLGHSVLPVGDGAHGAGHAGCLPADRPKLSKETHYDQARSLNNLIGFLSTTDSQRLRQQAAVEGLSAAYVWQSLEQRAKSEQWFLGMQVSTHFGDPANSACAHEHAMRPRPSATGQLTLALLTGGRKDRPHWGRAVCRGLQSTLERHARCREGAEARWGLPSRLDVGVRPRGPCA